MKTVLFVEFNGEEVRQLGIYDNEELAESALSTFTLQDGEYFCTAPLSGTRDDFEFDKSASEIAEEDYDKEFPY